MPDNAAFKKAARSLAARENMPYAEARTRLLTLASDMLDRADRVGTRFAGDPKADLNRPVLVAEHASGVTVHSLESGWTLHPYGVDVLVRDQDGAAVGRLHHLPTSARLGGLPSFASPTGFSWGYSGSGPSDFARSLLTAVMGADAACTTCDSTGVTEDDDDERLVTCTNCRGVGVSLPLVMVTRLRDEVIANLPRDREWVLPVEVLRQWVLGMTWTVERDMTEDFAVPYPLNIYPDGRVFGQDFWRGEYAYAIGVVPTAGGTGLTAWAQVTENPAAAIGQYLVTTSTAGVLSSSTTKLTKVTPGWAVPGGARRIGFDLTGRASWASLGSTE